MSLDPLDDWLTSSKDTVDARLRGAKQIQDQLRFSLAVMAVISVMMLTASYNAYLSFDRGWALEMAGRRFGPQRTAADVLTEQALRSWADSRNVAISLLGIRVNVDDAPVLGTLSLFVVSLWLVQVARRENQTIGSLLQDTKRTPEVAGGALVHRSRERRLLVYHTLVSNSLFTNIHQRLARIRSLSPAVTVDGGRPFKVRLERLLARLASLFFFYLPPVSCLVMFGLDRLSYFQPSAFRPAATAPGMAGFFWPSVVVFALCWIPLVVCCARARLYLDATETVLREYHELIEAPAPARV